MTTTTSALTVECAKPGCHWKGAASDAPTHPCPTPAPLTADETTRMLQARDDARVPTIDESFLTEEQQAEARANSTRFAAERADLEQRLTEGGVSYSPELSLEELRGLAQLLVDEPPRARQPEPTLSDGTTVREAAEAFGREDDGPPAYDSDPVTLDDHAAWLAAHGMYDTKGAPADERTATLDARYGVLVDQERAAAEPTLEQFANDPEAAVEYQRQVDAEQDAETAAFLEETKGLERPWQTVIAQALNAQGSVAAYKWLVVWHPTDPSREAELIGRGKTKNEATVIAEDTIARGRLGSEIGVVKTADVLKAAEQLEQEGAPDAAPAQTEAAAVEETPLATPPANTATFTIDLDKTTLFDTDDYRDPSLALPQIDGHDIDRIAIAFQGEIMLDRSDPDHVALWRRLKLGKRVELWVEAKGLGYAGKGATNKDGELDVIVAKRTVTVQHVRVMGPEDLQEAALELSSQARDAAEAQDARDRRPDDA